MKKHNSTSPPRLAALLAGAALLGLVSQSALALGTASNIPINNKATLAYRVSGADQTPIDSNTVTFVVDNKINLTVTGTGTSIVPNSINQALAFTVANIGNTSQSYTLAASVSVGATATMTLVGIYNDDSSGAGSGPGVYNGTNTVYVAGAATVAAGGSLKVLIVASQTTPTASDTNSSTWNLLATTDNAGTSTATTVVANTQAGVEAVFAEGAANTALDALNDGKQSNTATYTVVFTAPTIAKTATLLCDPFTAILANAKNIPGSITQWSIAINNPSAVAVTLTSIADVLDTAHLTIDPNLVNPTTAANCVSATGPVTFLAGSGFKVVPSASRNLGGSAGGAAAPVSYFTTTTTADGLDFATPNITATFATILPVDAGHLTAGLLNPGETVTLYFNTTLN